MSAAAPAAATDTDVDAGAAVHPLIVHAHALSAAGATAKRVRSVLSLGEAAAAANGTSSATCAAQAGTRRAWRQQKALGLHGLATVLDESITDWDSALEVPGGRSGTLLGSGALLNAGCKRCSNVRISKVEWCETLQAYSAYFTLKRSVRRGTELLLFYKVRGALRTDPRGRQALVPLLSPAASAPLARLAPQPVTRKCAPQEQTLR